MALKDILLYMDASPTSQNRLDLASAIAQRFDAHLTGLLVKPQLMPVGYVMVDFGVTLDGDVFTNVADEQRIFIEKAAASAERRFREQLGRDGVAFEWRSVVGSVAQQISLQARYADIAVIGQPDPNGRSLVDQLSVAGEILLTSGRPLLVVPYTGCFPTIGERVLIAWNGSREAARAVNDALPFLVEAKSVTVLSINPQSGSAGKVAVPGADLAAHLARHGAKVEAASMIGNEISVGDMLSARAEDSASDLIVMGAYGHSRFRELLLGGATRSLLKVMTVPVLMSH